MTVFGDFETRSEADLKKVGVLLYAQHPSTEPVCLCWTVDHDPRVWIWHPGFEDLSFKQAAKKRHRTHTDLAPIDPPQWVFDRLASGELFEAHNSFFERCIWRYVMHARYGWPDVPDEQWRCSAARAATFALRPKLEYCTADLGLAQTKDTEGHKAMLKLSKPRRPTKSDPDSKFMQKRRDLLRVFRYCVQDVRAQRELSYFLPPMPDVEIKTWQLDQKMNLAGVPFDRALAVKAIEIGTRATKALESQIRDVTGGEVKGVQDRAAMIQWLKDYGVDPPIKIKADEEEIETTERKGLEKLLKAGGLPAAVKLCCELWIKANKTSTKKYNAMIARMDARDLVYEILRYHAASTGRWGGMGVQVQNFPRNCPEDIDEVCRQVLELGYEEIALLYGEESILDVLSQILRGSVVVGPDEEMHAIDFNAIEARGVAWLSGDTDFIKAFVDLDADPKADWDIYSWQASQIYGTKVPKKDKLKRAEGKVAVLGLGYQMGAKKLVAYAEGMGVILTFERAEEIVKQFRKAHWKVVKLWYDMEACAIQAVRTGAVVNCGKLKFGVAGRFLYMRLPSGRFLAYLDPIIEFDKKFNRPKLTFMGMNTYTHQWERCSTYGGKLCENAVQALCRDLLRDAMLRCADRAWRMLMTVHDEIVRLTKKNSGDFEEFKRVVLEVPSWAEGMPINGDGWISRRYRK